jgi:pimeloyl-ACP methyl ester carboxylesterase
VSLIKKLITIKGKKMEVLVKGKIGSPIVILTGMGCSFDEWHEVTEQLSKMNRAIMFHRPGLGESEIGNDVRNTEAVAKELMELMLHLKIEEPIILVGHSYGGLCAQHFVKLYPQYLSGLILVDATSVDLIQLDELDLPVLNEDSTDKKWMETCQSYSLMSKDELRELIQPTLSEKQKQLPQEIRQRLIDFQVNPSLFKAMYSEIKNWKKDAELIKSLGDFPNIPLIVVGRDKEHCIQLEVNEGFPEWELRLFEDKWQELIMNQTNLSSDSELILAKGASHSVYLDRPDIVIDSINKLIGEYLILRGDC